MQDASASETPEVPAEPKVVVAKSLRRAQLAIDNGKHDFRVLSATSAPDGSRHYTIAVHPAISRQGAWGSYGLELGFGSSATMTKFGSRIIEAFRTMSGVTLDWSPFAPNTLVLIVSAEAMTPPPRLIRSVVHDLPEAICLVIQEEIERCGFWARRANYLRRLL